MRIEERETYTAKRREREREREMYEGCRKEADYLKRGRDCVCCLCMCTEDDSALSCGFEKNGVQ